LYVRRRVRGAVRRFQVVGVLIASGGAAVQSTNARDVVGRQGRLDAGVARVHGGGDDAGVVQPQGVADLVAGDREQVVGGADVERLAGVELEVAGDGVVVHRRRQIALGEGVAAEVVAGDANVTEAGVALLVVAAAQRRAVVWD